MLSDDCDAAAPTTGAEVALACSLTHEEQEARGLEVRALFASATASEALPDGVLLTFPGGDAFAQRLLAFVLFERACCPFFSFALRATAPHERIQLELRGPATHPEIVKETFAPALALIHA